MAHLAWCSWLDVRRRIFKHKKLFLKQEGSNENILFLIFAPSPYIHIKHKTRMQIFCIFLYICHVSFLTMPHHIEFESHFLNEFRILIACIDNREKILEIKKDARNKSNKEAIKGKDAWIEIEDRRSDLVSTGNGLSIVLANIRW